MSDSDDASSHTSRPPRAGHGNPPLWVPGHQHGSEAMIGFGLNHTNEPSNPGHNILRALQQQHHQFDPYASRSDSESASTNQLLHQPASYPVPTTSAISAPSAAHANALDESLLKSSPTSTPSGVIQPPSAPDPPNPPTSGSGQFHPHPMRLPGTSMDPEPASGELFLHSSGLPACSPAGVMQPPHEHAPPHAPLPGYQPVVQQPQQQGSQDVTLTFSSSSGQVGWDIWPMATMSAAALEAVGPSPASGSRMNDWTRVS